MHPHREATMMPIVIFVDVDDTLIRSAGSKRIPIRGMIERVRELHLAGIHLYCWSSAGGDYAHRTATELDLAHSFLGFLPKPTLLVDDQPPSEWRTLHCLHPNEASTMPVETILAKARGSTG
jgi:hypothetical protein